MCEGWPEPEDILYRLVSSRVYFPFCVSSRIFLFKKKKRTENLHKSQICKMRGNLKKIMSAVVGIEESLPSECFSGALFETCPSSPTALLHR